MHNTKILEFRKELFFGNQMDEATYAVLGLIPMLDEDPDNTSLVHLMTLAPGVFNDQRMIDFVVATYGYGSVKKHLPHITAEACYRNSIMTETEALDRLRHDTSLKSKITYLLMNHVKELIQLSNSPLCVDEFIELMLSMDSNSIFDLVSNGIYDFDKRGIDELKSILQSTTTDIQKAYCSPSAFWSKVPASAFDLEMITILMRSECVNIVNFGLDSACKIESMQCVIREHYVDFILDEKSTFIGLKHLFKKYPNVRYDSKNVKTEDISKLILEFLKKTDDIFKKVKGREYLSKKDAETMKHYGFVFSGMLNIISQNIDTISENPSTLPSFIKIVAWSDKIEKTVITNTINEELHSIVNDSDDDNFELYVRALFDTYIDTNGFKDASNKAEILSVFLADRPGGPIQSESERVKASPLNELFKARKKHLFALTDDASGQSVADMAMDIIEYIESRYALPSGPWRKAHMKQLERTLSNERVSTIEFNSDLENTL